MANEPFVTVFRHLRRLVGAEGDGGLSDAQLLERFVTKRDEAAFEVLLWRHGPMVLNLCRRVLNETHAAEDAFQATFLVFVKKAGSVGKGQAVGSWLYKVAYRVALQARALASKHAVHSLPTADLAVIAQASAASGDLLWSDLRPLLDEEVSRLPEKYRSPIILCDLAGMTHAEAAEELGCPQGTVSVRLMRARERLRSRLIRRGVAISAGAVVTLLCENAGSAAMPSLLVPTTLEAALQFAARKAATAGTISVHAVTLAQKAMKGMFMTKLKFAAGAVLAIGLLATGAGVYMGATEAGDRATDAGAASASATDGKQAASQPAQTEDQHVALAQKPGGQGGGFQGFGGGGVQGFAGGGFQGQGGGFGAGFAGFGGPGAGFGGSCHGGFGYGNGSGGPGGAGFGGGKGGGGGFGGGGFGSGRGSGSECGPFALLTQEQVQKELKLSKDQLNKLQKLIAKPQELPKPIAKPGVAAKSDDLRSKEAIKAREKAVSDILMPEQLRRLKEISLQLRGGQAFNDPEVAEALKLTSEQKEKVKTIHEEAIKSMESLFRPAFNFQASGNFQEMQKQFAAMAKKFEDVRKSIDEQLMNLLTDEQKATWRQLTGEPFRIQSDAGQPSLRDR